MNNGSIEQVFVLPVASRWDKPVCGETNEPDHIAIKGGHSMEFHGKLSRRSFLTNSSAAGALTVGSTWGGKLLAASHLPDPQSVLNDISISKYVRADYRDLYGMSDDKPIWDNSKDWIRTVDWEAVRSELAGTTVRFAIGAADAESAAEGLVPFEALSGISVELVPIPDDSFYDKALAEFISGNASFDALQFFSPWLGDFAAPGFLYPLQDFADKWNLPLDDFYDTYRLNYGYFNGQMYGIPFDCDIQMVHLRKGYVEQVLGGPIDKVSSVPSYDELIRLSAELNNVEPGVSGVGLDGRAGFLVHLHLGTHRGTGRNDALRRELGANFQWRCRQQGSRDYIGTRQERQRRACGRWLAGKPCRVAGRAGCHEHQLAGQWHTGDAPGPVADRR